MRSLIKQGLTLAFGLSLVCLGSLQAPAQDFDTPWQFNRVDRAGIAVVMRQANGGLFDQAAPSSSTSTITQYVCGDGTGTTSATGNSACVILGAGSNGNINTGQNNDGNPSASSSLNDMIDQLANGNN